VYFEEPSFYAASVEELLAGDKGGVAVLAGRTVVDLNVYRKKLQLDDQRVINFDKCLLATGLCLACFRHLFR
jgi:programmed cell death 8 (apoptosis-inducing factor)